MHVKHYYMAFSWVSIAVRLNYFRLEMSRANELCPYVPFLFILMSYCDAGSLEDLLWPQVGRDSERERDGYFSPSTLPDSTIWSLLIDITLGMQHLHRNYVLHRDLKPSNILLTVDATSACGVRAVLSDFGTAEIVGSEATRVAHSGFTGTVEYTAPEVLSENSGHECSEASDMWSLGILVHAMCYNAVPYRNSDPQLCARMIISDSREIQLPSAPERDSDLKNLITALTARDATLRPCCSDILFHPFVREKNEARYRR